MLPCVTPCFCGTPRHASRQAAFKACVCSTLLSDTPRHASRDRRRSRSAFTSSTRRRPRAPRPRRSARLRRPRCSCSASATTTSSTASTRAYARARTQHNRIRTLSSKHHRLCRAPRQPAARYAPTRSDLDRDHRPSLDHVERTSVRDEGGGDFVSSRSSCALLVPWW